MSDIATRAGADRNGKIFIRDMDMNSRMWKEEELNRFMDIIDEYLKDGFTKFEMNPETYIQLVSFKDTYERIRKVHKGGPYEKYLTSIELIEYLDYDELIAKKNRIKTSRLRFIQKTNKAK